MTSMEKKIENDKKKERMQILRSERQEKIDIKELEQVKLENMKTKTSKDKERKIKYREERSEEQWKKDCELDKERKRQKRLEKSFEDWKDDCELDKERKKIENEVEKEYALLSLKHRNRKYRNLRSGKMKLEQNLKAKEGEFFVKKEG